MVCFHTPSFSANAVKGEISTVMSSDEGLMLELSALLSLHGGNLILTNLFDAKF